MAFTRKMLKALGIEEEKIEQIMEAHTEVTDALKEQRDGFEEQAKLYSDTKKELDALKKSDWQKKYEKEHSDFESYKTSAESEKTLNAKKTAYKALLKEANISDTNNRYDAIVKLADLDSLELTDNGFSEKDKILKSLKSEYAGFIVEKNTSGANTANPPANNGGKLTKKQIFEIKDPAERQRAIAENHELFGI